MTTYSNIFNAIIEVFLLKALKNRNVLSRANDLENPNPVSDSFWSYTEQTAKTDTTSFDGIL